MSLTNALNLIKLKYKSILLCDKKTQTTICHGVRNNQTMLKKGMTFIKEWLIISFITWFYYASTRIGQTVLSYNIFFFAIHKFKVYQSTQLV